MRALWFPPGNHLYLLSELAGVDGAGDLVLGLPLPPLLPAEGVVAGAVLGLALPEAHADVALELDRVAEKKEEKDAFWYQDAYSHRIHSIFFIRDIVKFGLVLSLKFLGNLTSFVPYLSLIILVKL